MSIKFEKPINFFKYILVFLGVLLVGLSCYLAYEVLREPWGEPEGIRVTNVTSRSATVTWVTEERAKGSVVVMDDGGLISGILARFKGDVFYDDRDISRVELDLAGEMNEESVKGISSEEVLSEMKVRDMKRYYVHHVTISGLDPESEYYFRIGNGLRYKSFNEGDLSENSENSFKTYAEVDEVPLPNPSYGGIKKQVTTVTHQEDVEEALVYMQAVDKDTESVSNYLSAVTNKNGNWYIDLANARDKESGGVMKGFDEDDFEMIDVEAGPEGSIEDRKIDADRDAPAVDLVILRDEELGESNASTIDGVIGRVYAGECKCIDADGGCWCNENCLGGEGWTPGSCSVGGSGGGSSSGGSSGGGGGDEVPTGGTPGERCVVKYTEVGALGTNDGCEYKCEGVGTYDQNGNCVNHWAAGSFCEKKDPNCGSVCSGGEVCREGESCAMGDYQCCTTGCVTVGQETGGRGGSSGGGGCVNNQNPVPSDCSPNDYMVDRPSADQCCGWCNNNPCRCSDGTTTPAGTKCGSDDGVGGGSSSTKQCDEVGESCCSGSQRPNDKPFCAGGLVCDSGTGECVADGESGGNPVYSCENQGDSCCWSPQRGDYCLGELVCDSSGTCVDSSGGSGESELDCGSHGERACTGNFSLGACPKDEAPNYTNGYCCKEEQEWINGSCVVVSSPVDCNEGTVGAACYVDGHLGSCQANESMGQYAGNALFSGGSASVGCMLGALGGAVQNVNSGNMSVPLSYVVSAGGGAVNGCVEGAQDLGELSDQGFDRVFTYSCQTAIVVTNDPSNENESQVDINENVFIAGNNYKGIINTISAQETESTEEYTISSEGYLFSPNEDGIYTLELPDGTIIEDVSMSKDINYTFFVDSNSDGEITSDETVQLASVTSIQVKKQSSLFNYTLEDGYNFVSFPFIPEERSSFDLIEKLNESDEISVTQIARYNSGKFEVSSFRSDINDEPSGDNFPITPGWGYLLRVYGDGNIDLAGQEVADSVELVFPHEGWYLSGVHGSSKSYTAESLIDSINDEEGLTVDNVTRWYTDTAKYEGLQKEKGEDGNSEVYGFDFAIEENKSYFVRVSDLEEAEARWKPE